MARPTRPAPSLALCTLLCLLPGAHGHAQEPGSEGPARTSEEDGLVLRDRVLAVVDDYPILSSDVDRAIALGLAQREPDESVEAFRRRVLESLIDQRVRLHEVTRFGVEQVPVEAIEEQVRAIRERFPSEEAFRRQLDQVGLNLEGLRQLVAQRLEVWVYFEEFLGPQVFVSLEDIRRYYEEVLVPAMGEAGREPPPIETVREDIRQILKDRRLNEAIEERTEALRREADVVSYFERESREMPPVVLELRPAAEPTSG